jgi:tetratricopeptide (TPR) repeat protein
MASSAALPVFQSYDPPGIQETLQSAKTLFIGAKNLRGEEQMAAYNKVYQIVKDILRNQKKFQEISSNTMGLLYKIKALAEWRLNKFENSLDSYVTLMIVRCYNAQSLIGEDSIKKSIRAYFCGIVGSLKKAGQTNLVLRACNIYLNLFKNDFSFASEGFIAARTLGLWDEAWKILHKEGNDVAHCDNASYLYNAGVLDVQVGEYSRGLMALEKAEKLFSSDADKRDCRFWITECRDRQINLSQRRGGDDFQSHYYASIRYTIAKQWEAATTQCTLAICSISGDKRREADVNLLYSRIKFEKQREAEQTLPLSPPLAKRASFDEGVERKEVRRPRSPLPRFSASAALPMMTESLEAASSNAMDIVAAVALGSCQNSAMKSVSARRSGSADSSQAERKS